MKYKKSCTAYCLHHGSLEKCWHLNARLVMSGWGQRQVCHGVRGKGQGSPLVSDLIRGLLPAECKASKFSAEHTQLHWEMKGPDGYYIVCVSCKRKKILKVTIAEAVHQKGGSAHADNLWLGSVPEGSFLVRRLIVWYVIQNMWDPHGDSAGRGGHSTATLWKWKPCAFQWSLLFWGFRKGSWWQVCWLVGQSNVGPTPLCCLRAVRRGHVNESL